MNNVCVQCIGWFVAVVVALSAGAAVAESQYKERSAETPAMPANPPATWLTYHLAFAEDDLLEKWSPPVAVEPKTKSGEIPVMRHWDPDCWLDGKTYYAVSGGRDPHWMKSSDLKSWEHLGRLLHDDMPDVGVPREEDIQGAIQSLPRELSLSEDGLLRIKPLRELETLRFNERSEVNLTFDSDAVYQLKGISGSSLAASITTVATALSALTEARAEPPIPDPIQGENQVRAKFRGGHLFLGGARLLFDLERSDVLECAAYEH